MRKTAGWLGFVNDIPITWKFMLIYFLCVLIPILTINGLFFRQITLHIAAREETNLLMTLDRASRSVMDLIEGAVSVSHSVAIDRSLYEALDRDYPEPVDFYDTLANSLRDKMKPFLSAYPFVEGVSIYTRNPTITSGGNYFRIDDKVMNDAWFRHATSAADVSLFVYPGVEPVNPQLPKRYFSIVRKMNEYPIYGKYAKYLKIDIRTSFIDDLLRQELPYMTIDIRDERGETVLPASASSRAFAEVSKAEERLTYSRPLGFPSYVHNWEMVGIASDDMFQGEFRNSGRFIWLLAAISTLVPTVLILIILRSYIYRVKRLARHMDKAQNEKFVRIDMEEGRDEIGGLIRSFNRMAETIETLINDVYKLEIQKKDLQLERVRAELKLLQSQVNPHFLFNTLNALLVVSAKNGYDKVTDPIRNLSLLLRRMLSWSDDAVPLQDELQFTESYLRIEKFRFTDRFEYLVETDESASRCLVPKMCIQPLVENACKHGLQSVKGQRLIRISARRENAYLHVVVEDNGIGIDAEQLHDIRNQLNGSLDTDGNVGLRNVYKRLTLHYGDFVDFVIESNENRGTRIRFRIPARVAGERGDDHV